MNAAPYIDFTFNSFGVGNFIIVKFAINMTHRRRRAGLGFISRKVYRASSGT